MKLYRNLMKSEKSEKRSWPSKGGVIFKVIATFISPTTVWIYSKTFWTLSFWLSRRRTTLIRQEMMQDAKKERTNKRLVTRFLWLLCRRRICITKPELGRRKRIHRPCSSIKIILTRSSGAHVLPLLREEHKKAKIKDLFLSTKSANVVLSLSFSTYNVRMEWDGN